MEFLEKLELNAGDVVDIDLSQNGDHLIVYYYDRSTIIYDLEERKIISKFSLITEVERLKVIEE